MIPATDPSRFAFPVLRRLPRPASSRCIRR